METRDGETETDKHEWTDGDLETDRGSEREKEGKKLTDVHTNKLWKRGVKNSEAALGLLVDSNNQKNTELHYCYSAGTPCGQRF